MGYLFVCFLTLWPAHEASGHLAILADFRFSPCRFLLAAEALSGLRFLRWLHPTPTPPLFFAVAGLSRFRLCAPRRIFFPC